MEGLIAEIDLVLSSLEYYTGATENPIKYMNTIRHISSNSSCCMRISSRVTSLPARDRNKRVNESNGSGQCGGSIVAEGNFS